MLMEINSPVPSDLLTLSFYEGYGIANLNDHYHHQGNPVQEATLVLRLGGRHVTEQLMNQV